MALQNEGPNAGQPDEAGTSIFGPYVVLLVDFLGQSNDLAKWNFLPSTVREAADWTIAVRNSVGRVLTWRERFVHEIREFSILLRKSQARFTPRLPTAIRGEFEAYRQSEVLHQHFSDTVVFYSRLQNNKGYWQVSSIGGMLATCGTLMLSALAVR